MEPHIVTKPPGPKARKTMSLDSRISPELTRAYPLAIESASGTNIWDADGNRYLDFVAGVAVANVGHSNPAVGKAIAAQLRKATHAAFTDFYSDVPLRLAEKLKTLLPKRLDTFFFSNSGTESIEAAMKMCRYHTRKPAFLAFHGAFHGRTLGSLSLTCSKPVQREGFEPLLEAIHVPYAYCYRCFFGEKYPGCGLKCAQHVERVVRHKRARLSSIFVEPIQGEGGYVVPPKEFHKELRRISHENGLLLVDDEVQAGCFRTGKFLAMEHWGVEPDIVCLSKAIGGGLPMGITAAEHRTMTWKHGSHANTMGGNLLASAAGLASLDFMIKKKLGANAAKIGQHMLRRLEAMKERHHHIGDVRGKGLMIGVEFVKDRRTKMFAQKERDVITLRAFERGLVLLPCGHSTIRFCPPLTITKKEADAGLDIFEECLP